MTFTRRTAGLLVAGTMSLFSPLVLHPSAQEEVPRKREITLTVRNYQFSPSRIEVAQGDLVKLTIESADIAHSFTIDEYRVSRRVPAGGTTTLEFRADRAGTFPFYCNLTSDTRHSQMKGELMVRAR